MIGWKEVGTAAIGLVIGAATWVGSAVIESKTIHAAQAVESVQQDKRLDDHEERMRSLDKAIQTIAKTGESFDRMAAELKNASEVKKRSR